MQGKTYIWLWAWLAGLLLLAGGDLRAQDQVYLSRYVPGHPGGRLDLIHRVEIFNPTTRFQDLSGFLLATRRYVLRLPDQTYLAPQTALRLGQLLSGGEQDLDFRKMEDFVQRSYSGTTNGDFAILYDPLLNLTDAFYFSDERVVDFLPNQETLPLSNGKVLTLAMPPESDGRWAYLQAKPDPAVAFVRIAGQWQTNSRTRNLIPATQYRMVEAQFVEGIVTVEWKTLFEQDCFFHEVERSTDGVRFAPIASKAAVGNTDQPQSYLIYDSDVSENRVYFYRIKHTDKFGYAVATKPVRIRTEEMSAGFTFDLIRAQLEGSATLDVRFSAETAQQIRIHLLDEEFRQVAVLFEGEVEQQRQNLVTYTQSLSVGKYYVIVDTKRRRYYEPFIVE